jgi:hypothetical protein
MKHLEIDHERSMVKLFAALSIAVHALLLSVAFIFRDVLWPPLVYEFGPGETRVLSEVELKRLLERVANRGQVVQSDPGTEVLDPKDTAPFVGTRTQRVQKQTRATQSGVPRELVGPKSRSSLNRLMPTASSLMTLASKDRRYQDEAMSTGLTHGSNQILPKDVVAGAETLLNTDEFIYASFQNRLALSVFVRWRALLTQAQADLEQTGEGVYYTTLAIRLSEAGEIEAVDVVQSSGRTKIDQFARAAFLQELRFKNPPKGLRDDDGKYRFVHGFRLTLSRQSQLQFSALPDPRLLPSGVMAR